MPQQPKKPTGFEQLYPNIAKWVHSYGWIEIGADLYSSSLVRAFDEGSTVWESKDGEASLDKILRTLDSILAQRMKEYYA